MDKLCFDNYIPKPKLEISSQKQEQKKVQNEAPQNPITKRIKEFGYKPKVIMSTNKMKEAASAFPYNNYKYRPEIQNIIKYVQNIDNYQYVPFTALDQKLYFLIIVILPSTIKRRFSKTYPIQKKTN